MTCVLSITKKKSLLCLCLFKKYFRTYLLCFISHHLNYFVLFWARMIFGLFFLMPPPKKKIGINGHFFPSFSPKNPTLLSWFLYKKLVKSLSTFAKKKKELHTKKNRNKSYMKIARSWWLFSLITCTWGFFRHTQTCHYQSFVSWAFLSIVSWWERQSILE